MNENRASILLLKFMEAVFCLICFIIHINGYSYEDKPLPHGIIYCGTYFGFLMHTVFGVLLITLNVPLSLVVEAISSTMASTLFVATAFETMVDVENDAHLSLLNDKEELAHPFFIVSRIQSIFSLITGFIFAMHSTLMWDMLCITERDTNKADDAYQPLQLHFFPYDVYRFIAKFDPENLHRQNLDERIDFSDEIRSNRNIDRII